MVEQIALFAVHTKGLATHSDVLPSSGLPVQGGGSQYLGTKRELLQPLRCVALSPVAAQEYSTPYLSHSSILPECWECEGVQNIALCLQVASSLVRGGGISK